MFTQLNEINSIFSFLYNNHNLQKEMPKEIMEHCLKLEKYLQNGELKDIDAVDLWYELQAIARRIPPGHLPQNVLNFICKNKLMESVPNTFVALRILLTLPVSVASGEQSFSKLMLIKTYIRSSNVAKTTSWLSHNIHRTWNC